MRCLLIFFTVFFPILLSAQVRPAEGARLNYRIIGFNAAVAGANKVCTLEVAEGHYEDAEAFARHVTISKVYDCDTVVEEVPEFGKEYTWCIYRSGIDERHLHHFWTLNNPLTDSFIKLSVQKRDAQLPAAYVFMDCSRALHDMDGRVVWFLPVETLNPTLPGGIQDLKATVAGTITYLMGTKMYETSYDGSLLRCISDSGLYTTSRGEAHHDATRMANGNYMMLGNETRYWKMEKGKVSLRRSPKDGYEMRIFGTISEVDPRGKLVWKFCPVDYIITSDLMSRRMPDGKPRFDEHLNAFFFDSVHHFLYLGFRNVDRILKVSYPEGKVERAYGAKFNDMGEPERNGLFCQQHGMSVYRDSLFLFDNNGCGLPPVPKIQVLLEDDEAPCGVRNVWEYSLARMEMPVGRSSGGNIIRLEGGNIFASLSLPYNDLVIVTRDKKEKWRATPMHRQSAEQPWQSINNYRASVLSSKRDLLNLIYGGSTAAK